MGVSRYRGGLKAALPTAENKKADLEAGFDMMQLVGETGFEPATSTSRT
jgi:hypothetical protein